MSKVKKQINRYICITCYSILLFSIGFLFSFGLSFHAIKMQKSIVELINIMQNDPVAPGWQQCTNSELIEGTNNFYLQLCKKGTTQEDYLRDLTK